MVHRDAGGITLCFPGQLSKVPKELGERGEGGMYLPHPFFKKAWERVGFDLSSFCFQREEEDRYLNLKLQVASYLLSIVSFDRYRNKEGRWDFITEHSMGIYAALVAAEAVTFEDGLEITKGIGLILEEAAKENPGGMAAVIGLDNEDIKTVCSDVCGDLYVANVNGSRQFVLSGDTVSVDRGIELSLKRGAISAQRLTFCTPLHSPLIESVTEDVHTFIASFDIRPPQTPLVSHWSGKHLSEPDEIRGFLAGQLHRPVDWQGCVQYLLSQGVTCFIEMNYHDTLAKLIRWIDRDVRTFSYGVRDII
jgi:[acyl-carrier-protein] S-malonyltransferase